MLDLISQHVRERIVHRVRATLSGASDGQRVIARTGDGYFAPGTVIRDVHGDVASMMVGGLSALLLQMLHPAVLAGVWDHSNFRNDMAGRLHRTARFIALTTFASAADADAAIATVKRIHGHISGTLPDGTPYRAADPRLLAWVHVTEATSFFDAWRRYGGRTGRAGDEGSYFKAFARIAASLGADPVPETRADADALIARMRPELAVDHRTREVARLVTRPPLSRLSMLPAQRLLTEAAIQLLPKWARALHGYPTLPASQPFIRAGTLGLANTIRWAFADVS